MYNEEISKTNENFTRYKERITNFSSEFELGLFLYILRKSIVWILLILFLSFLASLLYLRYTVPIYESSLILQVNSSNTAGKILQVENIYEIDDISASIELLRSKYLINRAIESLPLEVSYFNKGQFLTYELYTSSPFTIHYNIADSSVLNRKFNLTFRNRDEVELSYIWKGEEYSSVHSIHEPFLTDWGEIEFSQINFDKIDELQSEFNKQHFIFTVRSAKTGIQEDSYRFCFQFC